MRNSFFGFVLSIAAVCSLGKDGEFSIWTRASDGKTIEAKIVSVSEQNAVFEMKNGAQHTFEKNIFIPEDQRRLAAMASTNRSGSNTLMDIPSEEIEEETFDNISEEEYRKRLSDLGFVWNQVDGLWIGYKGAPDSPDVTKVQINESTILSGFRSVSFTFLHSGKLSAIEAISFTEILFSDQAREDFRRWLSANLETERFAGRAIHDRMVFVIASGTNDAGQKLTDISITPNSVGSSELLEMMIESTSTNRASILNGGGLGK
jgi:hypothetical protein